VLKTWVDVLRMLHTRGNEIELLWRHNEEVIRMHLDPTERPKPLGRIKLRASVTILRPTQLQIILIWKDSIGD
jgi:hypothetical protein